MTAAIVLVVAIITIYNHIAQCHENTNNVNSNRINKWVHMENANLEFKPHLKQMNRADPDALHRVMFARKQSNMAELKDILHSVSDPRSPDYGKHLTRQEIAELTAYPHAEREIKRFLQEQGIEITRITKYGDYISAVAPISKWEEIFNNEFYEFEDINMKRNVPVGLDDIAKSHLVVRALSYSLPEQLVAYVDAAFYTVQLPVLHNLKRPNVQRITPDDDRYEELHAKLHRSKSGTALPTAVDQDIVRTLRGGDHKDYVSSKYLNSRFKTLDIIIDGYVTPDLINDEYDIYSNKGSPNTSQAIYAALGQTVSPSDLEEFQDYFNLPEENIAYYYGGYVDDNACTPNADDCIEANLDIQYIMAVAQNVPTTWYYWGGNDPWLDWIEEVADMDDPPAVWSISYGSYEDSYSSSYLNSFSNEAIKLSAAGVTITAASGDDGVAGFLVRDGSLPCGYWPMFPASNPYVVAVGGTMGPEEGNDEKTCQSDEGSSITTGGGFSNFYSQDSFQNDFVDQYFDTVDGTNKEPASGYQKNKRAYPDVALLANNYLVMADDEILVVSGTSASSPVFAAMVALVNSVRVDAGNSTLGWLNPLLYSDYLSFANDVTSGDNKCLAAGYGCCTQGFYATSGWDPATGLGSVNYADFLLALANEQSVKPDGDDDDSGSNGLGTLIVVAIIVVVLVAIGVVSCFLYYVCCKPKPAPATAQSTSVPATTTANPSVVYYD